MNQSNNYLKILVNNPLFILVVSIASIIGLTSLFFPAHKRPFYSIKSFNLINNSSSTIENLDIKYKICNNKLEKENCKLENINSLTVTKILFWNGGRTKIDKTDIDDNPITIVASEDNKILEVKLLHSSNSRTDFRLNQKGNIINFDFLDSGNGGVIQVVHTGLSDKDIILDGYVEYSKFEGNIKLIQLKDYSEPDVISFILYLILLIWIIFMFFYSFNQLRKDKDKNSRANKAIDKLEEKLQRNDLSSEEKIVIKSELKLEKSSLPSSSSYSSYKYLICLSIVYIIFLLYSLSSELFLHKFTLRYPIDSYKIFSSEINN